MIKDNLKKRFGMRSEFCLGLLLLNLLIAAVPVQADPVQYIYDELGRLVRVINPDDTVATYTYDAVGNLLGISHATVDQLRPVISNISPDSFKIGRTTEVTLSGTGLIGGVVTTDNPGVTVLNSRSTETTILAAFDVKATARLGPTTVEVTTPLGAGTASTTIKAPLLTLNPPELIIEKGKTGIMTILLDEALASELTVSFTSSDPAVATVTPSVIIPAGQLEASATVTGVAAGFAAITGDVGGEQATANVSVALPFTGQTVLVSPPVTVLFSRFSGSTIIVSSKVSVLNSTFTGQATAVSPEVTVLLSTFAGQTTVVSPGVSVSFSP